MVEFRWEKGVLTALLQGEIDHHHARQMRQQIDAQISTGMPQLLRMDFGGVTFMDSSGIGLIMGRFRNMESLGGKVKITGANPTQRKVMRLAGLDRLVSFE